jgi:acetyl-CoA C-acetyltransferase
MTDPRTPVVIGVAQHTQRPDDVADVRAALEPVDLMARCVRDADTDAGGRSLLARLDTIFVPQPLSRRYPDPGALVARRLGIEGVSSVRALVGGNSPQLILNEAAASIARGERDVVVLTGAEAQYSRVRARRDRVELPWERADVEACPNEIGDSAPGSSSEEFAHGAGLPIHVYPMFETAIRHRMGRGVDEHQRAVGALWARLAAAAARNPHAWSPTAWSPEQIVHAAPDNRVVAFPYTKRMCANLTVDMGAAVLMTSLATARDAGVPDDRIVYPLAGADAHDHVLITERDSLADSPALRTAARAALAAAHCDVDAVARFDLYSCFPSAVEVALDALSLSAHDERPVSLTGGLAFFGGPGNNYVTHSIASAVESCRADPGSRTLVTGVGWYLTKHSVGLYSTTPPEGGFTRVDPSITQAEVDALPRRQPAGAHDGDVVLEATAVVHDRDGSPETAIVAGLTDDGRRALAVCASADATAAMVDEPWEGRRVTLHRDDDVNRVDV